MVTTRISLNSNYFNELNISLYSKKDRRLGAVCHQYTVPSLLSFCDYCMNRATYNHENLKTLRKASFF